MLRANNFFATILTTVTLLGFANCSSTQVKTSKDPQANLAQYKTYAWMPASQSSQEKPAATIMDETIKDATDKQLAARGLRKVPSSKADMLISYSATTQNKVTYGVEPGYWGWGVAPEEAYVQKEGSLSLQFIDPRSHRTIWQGTALEAVGDVGASQKDINTAVKDLLDKYPKA